MNGGKIKDASKCAFWKGKQFNKSLDHFFFSVECNGKIQRWFWNDTQMTVWWNPISLKWDLNCTLNTWHLYFFQPLVTNSSRVWKGPMSPVFYRWLYPSLWLITTKRFPGTVCRLITIITIILIINISITTSNSPVKTSAPSLSRLLCLRSSWSREWRPANAPWRIWQDIWCWFVFKDLRCFVSHLRQSVVGKVQDCEFREGWELVPKKKYSE